MNLIESLWERIEGKEGEGIPIIELRKDALVLADAYVDIGDEARAELVRILARTMAINSFGCFDELPDDIEDSPSYQRCFRRACRLAKTTENKATFAETISAFREYVEILPIVVVAKMIEGNYKWSSEWIVTKEGERYYLTFDKWAKDELGGSSYRPFEARIPKRKLPQLLSLLKQGDLRELEAFAETLSAKRL